MRKPRESKSWQCNEVVALSNAKNRRAKQHSTYVFQPQTDGGAFVVGTCVELSESHRFEQRMSEVETKKFYKQLLQSGYQTVDL
jgi:hypothetical protein